jgi:SpoVK/Ycf46/Vps4 family AAA+-type ATPase
MPNDLSPTERLFQAARRFAIASGHEILSLEDLAMAFYAVQELPRIEPILASAIGKPRTSIIWPSDMPQRWALATGLPEASIPAGMAFNEGTRQVLQSAFEGWGSFDLLILAKGALLSDTYTGQEMRRLNAPQHRAQGPESQIQRLTPYKGTPRQRKESMRVHLKEHVLGQDGAVQVLVQAYQQSMLCPSTLGVKGVFTLLGPPGTGKSSLCRHFASGLQALEGEGGVLVIDVGTYTTDYSQDQLFGFSKSYRDAQPGVLTDYVRQHPGAVILLDEIEKANPHFLQGILGILDHGKARDNFHGQDIDFSRSWICITSNLGQEFFREDAPRAWSRAQLLGLLDEACEPSQDEEFQGRRILSPEMISRLSKGHVLAMGRLTGTDLVEVFRRSAKRKLKALKLPNLELGMEEALLCLLPESRELDARKADARGDAFASALVPDLLEAVEHFSTARLRVTAGTGGRRMARAKLDAVPLRIALWGPRVPFDAALAAKALRIRDLEAVKAATQPLLGRADAVLLHFPRRAEPQWLDCLDGVPVLAMAPPSVRRRMLAFHPPASSWTWCTPQEGGSVGPFLDSLRMDRVFREQARTGTNVTPQFLPLIQEDGDLVLRLDDAKETREAPCPSPGGRPQLMAFPQGGFDQLVGLEEPKALLRVAGRLLVENNGTLTAAKGYLLTGPPGCGKTSLARALAAEIQVPFFAVTPADLASRYRDTAAVRLRELFREASRHAPPPAVIFIDELDSIGTARSASSDGAANRCVTALLTCMDGLHQRDRPLLVVAATNHLKMLDPALLRPGRFDGIIPLALPDVQEREAILRHVLARIPTEGSLDLTALARCSFQFSPAAIDGLARMAMQWALRGGRSRITQADLEQALEWTQLGPRSGRKEKADDRRICAAHEAGHAVVQAKLRPQARLTRLDIVSRINGAGGVTQALPAEGGMPTPRFIREEIAILMAGRAGEALLVGCPEDVTAGCQSDLERAARIARRAILSYGFDPDIGIVAISEDILASAPTLAAQVQNRVRAWISDGIRLAEETLAGQEPLWRLFMDSLLEREVLTEGMIRTIIEDSLGPCPERHR